MATTAVGFIANNLSISNTEYFSLRFWGNRKETSHCKTRHSSFSATVKCQAGRKTQSAAFPCSQLAPKTRRQATSSLATSSPAVTPRLRNWLLLLFCFFILSKMKSHTARLDPTEQNSCRHHRGPLPPGSAMLDALLQTDSASYNCPGAP